MHTSTGAFVRDSHFIQVRQEFQAVGHGTFFAGIAWRLDGCGTVFRWVYDCGSKRTKRIATAIGALPHGFEQIDLLVISHFDDDHINGIEELIRTRRVCRLALPYLDFPQRLAQAASIEGEVTSCSTALFQLDPLGWLARKGVPDSKRASATDFRGRGACELQQRTIGFPPHLMQMWRHTRNSARRLRRQQVPAEAGFQLGVQLGM